MNTSIYGGFATAENAQWDVRDLSPFGPVTGWAFSEAKHSRGPNVPGKALILLGGSSHLVSGL